MRIKYVLWLVCIALSFNARTSNFQLESGLWEGITPDDFSYHLFEINTEKSHRYITSSIGNGFRTFGVYPFSNKDIVCDSLSCTVNIPQTKRNDESIRLITALHADESVKVLKITANAAGEPLLAEHIQLKRGPCKSTVRTFIEQHAARMQAPHVTTGHPLAGFWLGVLTIDDQHHLLNLDVQPEASSRFSFYLNGSATEQQVLFDTRSIVEQGGHFSIRSSNSTLVSQLQLQPVGSNMLTGYFYSEHRGAVLRAGSLRLIKFNNKPANQQN